MNRRTATRRSMPRPARAAVIAFRRKRSTCDVAVRSLLQTCPDSALRSAPPVRRSSFSLAPWLRGFSVEAHRGQAQPATPPRRGRGRAAGPKLTVPPGFSVAEVYPAAKAGSIVNLTFDGDGVLVVAKENGPIVRLRDTDGDGMLDTEQVITDAITNCQGLLFAGRDLLATCDGPDKPTIASLYRVPDANGDGVGEAPVLVARSTYAIGEHGAHALVFGPDGDVYWMIGNFGGTEAAFSPRSPFENAGEEQLLPVMGDARGHGNQVRAPAGFISRMRLADIIASTGPSTTPEIELVAGGFRNAYDAAFNLAGELFTFDSDMEWDINLPWYRPVRTLHLIPGADFGFRYGSGPFPTVYPGHAAVDVRTRSRITGGRDLLSGRGVPGRVPRCVPGRRLVARPHPRRPPAGQRRQLHRDDLRVRARHAAQHHRRRGGGGRLGLLRARRPDARGAACIASGTPRPRAPARRRRADPIARALAQPQPRSAFGRKAIEDARRTAGASWDSGLKAIVSGTDPGPRRARALELLHVHGQTPDVAWLTTLVGRQRQRSACGRRASTRSAPHAPGAHGACRAAQGSGRVRAASRPRGARAFGRPPDDDAAIRSGRRRAAAALEPGPAPPVRGAAPAPPCQPQPVARGCTGDHDIPGGNRRAGRAGADGACADRRPAAARPAGGADRRWRAPGRI